MAMSLKNILQNVRDISMSESSLEMVLDMERVLDQMNVYAFKNWKKGELVKGPVIEKYFVSCVFMWPYRKMPDPRGARRLAELNCEIKYKKSRLEFPIKVKNYDDFKPGTKVPKLGSIPVWLVSVTMPKNLIRDISRKSIEFENDIIDLEDIEEAYEQDFDQDQFKTQEKQNEETGQLPQG